MATAKIYRPFTSGALIATVGATVTPEFLCASSGVLTGGLSFTHYIDVPAGTDVRDGLNRTLGTNLWNYSDGDCIVIDDAAAFVVVRAEEVEGVRRCWCLRHCGHGGIPCASLPP